PEEHHVMHAKWIQEEMPVRLAHRLMDFFELPFVVICNARFHEVFRLFLHAFETLVETPPVKDSKDVEAFAGVLRQLVRGHDHTIHMLQEGYGELQTLLDGLIELDDFLNQTCFTRIGNRVLAEHFLEVHEARSSSPARDSCGVVDPHVCPADIVRELASSLGGLCDELFGHQIEVVLDGELGTTVAFVPEHLHFVLQEILKNAMRATLERHFRDKQLPPVTVSVLKGTFDVTLKISDRGGGMPREQLLNVWRYGYTSAKQRSPLKQKDDFDTLCGRDPASMRRLAGYGFGLPLSRVYA
ncbi:BCKDK, partial [Symbiodinium pilosum]